MWGCSLEDGRFHEARICDYQCDGSHCAANVPTEPAQMVKQGPDGFFAYSVSPGDPLERRTIAVAAIQDRLAISGGLYWLAKRAPHRPGLTT
jgi:hypothetical protein